MSGIRAARRIVQAAQQVLRLAAQVVKHLVKQSVEHPVKHLVEVAVVPMPPADPHIAAACSAQAEHTVASVASASVTVPQTAVPVEVATVALTAIAPGHLFALTSGKSALLITSILGLSAAPFMVMMLNLTVITG